MSQFFHQGCSSADNDIPSNGLHAENRFRSKPALVESGMHSTYHSENAGTSLGLSMCAGGNVRDIRDSYSETSRTVSYSGTSHTITTFTCNSCQKQFLSKSALVRHVFSHMPDTPNPGDICELCGEVFQSQAFLQRHVMSHHVGKCLTNGALLGHRSENHTGDTISDESTDQPPRKKLRCVENAAEDLLYCTLCNKSFMRLDNLRRHYMLHTGEKPYRCDTCCKSFVQRGMFVKHQFAHTGIQPYACSSCPEKFSCMQLLRQHTLFHASGSGATYTCEMCGIPFADHAGLRRHWMGHSGEDPYQCDICSKPFAHPGHLRMHRLGHLEETPFM